MRPRSAVLDYILRPTTLTMRPQSALFLLKIMFIALFLTLMAACQDTTAPDTATDEVASVVFPTAVDFREGYPGPWDHVLDENGFCHVRAEIGGGWWPTKYGTIVIYPTVFDGTQWVGTGEAYLYLMNIVALDRLFSPKGWHFDVGTFDAVVTVQATNGRQKALTSTPFRCRT